MALKDDANELKGILGDIKSLLKSQSEESSAIADSFEASKKAMDDLIEAGEKFSTQQKDLSSSELDALSEKIKSSKKLLSLSQSGLKDQITQQNQILQLNK